MLSGKSKRQTDEDESSDEQFRCGRVRSSEEVSVMEMERRSPVIYTSRVKQPKGRILLMKESRFDDWITRAV